MYEDLREEILLYFLTEFPTGHPVAYLEAVAKQFLLSTVAEDVVTDFWAQMGDAVQEDIVTEFNRRMTLKLPMRFEVVDEVGAKVRGVVANDPDAALATLQDALKGLTHSEFEALSARVLEWAGCSSFWSTPQSHDEGLDAFGHMYLAFCNLDGEESGFPALCMLAQAKHYSKEKVRTGHVRELVGSAALAASGIYSSAAQKYRELRLRPFAPVCLFLITSGEVSKTARGLAKSAGVFLMTSRDVLHCLQQTWEASGKSPPDSVEAMKQELDSHLRGIPQAR